MNCKSEFYGIIKFEKCFDMHDDISRIIEGNILIYGFIINEINVLNREKFLRLTMGFGYFMYSHSLVPVIDLWFRVVTKLVSEQWFHC